MMPYRLEMNPKFTVERVIRRGKIDYTSRMYIGLIKGNTPEGRLPNDPAAHACWHYFGIASIAYDAYRNKLVYEDDASVPFHGRDLFMSVARMYCVDANDMGRYWDLMRQQRIALGLDGHDDLPAEFRYKNLVV